MELNENIRSSETRTKPLIVLMSQYGTFSVTLFREPVPNHRRPNAENRITGVPTTVGRIQMADTNCYLFIVRAVVICTVQETPCHTFRLTNTTALVPNCIQKLFQQNCIYKQCHVKWELMRRTCKKYFFRVINI